MCSTINSKQKTLLFEYTDIFGICVKKTKVSCILKIQILSFMTTTLFTRILGDNIYLSKYAQKGYTVKNTFDGKLFERFKPF